MNLDELNKVVTFLPSHNSIRKIQLKKVFLPLQKLKQKNIL